MNKKALETWKELHKDNLDIENGWEEFLLLSVDDVIEIETIAAELEYKEKLEHDKNFRKAAEAKANIETWEDFEVKFDSFHLDLIKYKETHSNDDFNKIWNELKKINRMMANKYFNGPRGLPMKARQIFLAETNSYDYSEFLTELMLKAIEAWRPENYVKFTTFYDRVIFNYVGGIKTKTKCKWYRNTEIISINTEEVEKLMDKIAQQHYKYDENGKMFMDTYIELFLRRINKIDNRLGLIFKALKDDNATHSEIAKYMSVSTKTVQRKIEIIKEEWLKYTAEVQ